MPPDVMELIMPSFQTSTKASAQTNRVLEENLFEHKFEHKLNQIDLSEIDLTRVPSKPLRFGFGYTNIWFFLTLSLLACIILYFLFLKK